MNNTILFLDIETVNQPTDDVPELFRKRFKREIQEALEASNYHLKEAENKIFTEKASIYAEFGRVACISLGKMQGDKFFIKSIINKDEKKILEQLTEALSKGTTTLCAHNGIEFDFPYLMRRYIINNLPIPPILNTMGKKPWELPFEDTMKMWSGSAWNYKCSLDLLAHCLGLPSPKQDMDGSKVAEVWYSACGKDELPFDHEEKVFKIISTYCQLDVLTLAQVYCRLKGTEAIKEEQIQYV